MAPPPAEAVALHGHGWGGAAEGQEPGDGTYPGLHAPQGTGQVLLLNLSGVQGNCLSVHGRGCHSLPAKRGRGTQGGTVWGGEAWATEVKVAPPGGRPRNGEMVEPGGERSTRT